MATDDIRNRHGKFVYNSIQLETWFYLYIFRIFDHPKGLIVHEIGITGYFSR